MATGPSASSGLMRRCKVRRRLGRSRSTPNPSWFSGGASSGMIVSPNPSRTTISGEKHRLWRAADQNGMVLDILVQSLRDAQAAKCQVTPSVEHRKHKG